MTTSRLIFINLICTLFFFSCNNNIEDTKTLSDSPLASESDEKDSARIPSSKEEITSIAEKNDTSKSLTVIVENLKSSDAPVIVGVYGPDNKFLDTNDQLNSYKFIPHSKTLVAKISDLKYGDLAMALYQDLDNDGEIDKDVIGIPKEPYAFSNNFRPRIKKPSFTDCKFSYSEKRDTISISLGK
jgi:uncharacterized protein (DUF2141 family)